MNNYAAGFSVLYNKTVETYGNMDIWKKTKIELYAVAGIVAVYLYYILPR